MAPREHRPNRSTAKTALTFLSSERSTERKGTMRYTTPFLLLALLNTGATTVATAPQQVGISPWGPKDEIGRLNLMTPASRSAILSRVSGQRSYDLAVDLYVGMPSWQAAGNPQYQMWLTHTPHGNVVADSMKLGEKMNRHVSYTGTAVSMYSPHGYTYRRPESFRLERQNLEWL